MTDWRLGSYQLQRKLGEGGMAQVYLARDVRLDREVAVKVLDQKLADRPGFRERFMREARLAAALDHPNIVPLYDFGDEDALYLVMPYLSGGSLQDLLPRAPLQTGEVVTYGSQIADALDYAHQRKVVHRDVKPANVLIHADGRLMLSDFGLAKIVSQTNTPNAPRNHPDAGTPEYMAPEQVVGSSDARSDIYGLGVVLYLLLTGRLPFTGSSSRDVMEAHLRRDPKPPRHYNSSIPPAMEAVVMRAMAKKPEDRFQRANELGAALLGALISDQAPETVSYISAPSDTSRPYDLSDPARGAYPSDQIGATNPHWRLAQTESNDPAHLPPAPGVYSDRNASSSITGLLPDLDLPFTTMDAAAPRSDRSDGRHIAPTAAYPGQWGSNTGAQSHGPTAPSAPASMPATLNYSGPVSPANGRFSNAPVSPNAHSHDTAPRIAARVVQMQQVQQSRPTAAPWSARVAHEPALVDQPAALPGLRVTNPPDQFLPQGRSPRLRIVIAVLLILLLAASIALWYFFQLGATGH
jgi:serine/threonine protein kinase